MMVAQAWGGDLRLLSCALAAVVGLVLLVARFQVNAFIALILASVFLGLCTGMDPSTIGGALQEGVGGVLGSVAVIIGLGAILGKLLAESGGAETIATTIVNALGDRRLPWTMAGVGFLVGIPVWFTVGLVLLAPVLFSVRRGPQVPLMRAGIPLLAGLSVAHGLVPPHPGPMAAIGLLGADVGKTILWSLVIGLPTVLVAGPVLANWLVRTPPTQTESTADCGAPDRFGGARLLPSRAAGQSDGAREHRCPGFLPSILAILLPVGLMLLATGASLIFPEPSLARRWLAFAGHPVVAMVVTVVFAWYSLGIRGDRTLQQVMRWSEEALGPVAMVLLVVGAGGGFSKVLIQSGVGEAVARVAGRAELSPYLFGWLAAALVRVATGSATVAITTAAGIAGPVAAQAPGTNVELLVVAMGAGSLTLSHVNDGGFWFVKEYLGLTVVQTLKTWTVTETVISLTGLALVLCFGRWF